MKPTALALPLLLLLAAGPIAIPSAEAQLEPLFAFDMQLQNNGTIHLPATGGASTAAFLHGNLTDNSKPQALIPGGPIQTASHPVTFTLEATPPVTGWSFVAPPPDAVQPGRTLPFRLQIIVEGTAESPFFRMQLTADILTDDGQHHYLHYTIHAFYEGLSVFLASDADYIETSPREFTSTTIYITNRYLEPHAFTIKVNDNPCGFGVVPPQQVVVGPLAKQEPFVVGLVTPADKLWYILGDTCILRFDVADAEVPSNVQTVQITAIITGVGADVPFFLNAALLLAAFLLLVFLLRRRKEKIEEEILGKPQKPWLIPVERVYLSALKRKDPRAWYVVRHYLMEDEYRSSLLWYRAYKSATRGDRKKERLILREERKYARWKKGWQARIAKPLKLADRYEAKLQRKLDRRSRRDLRRSKAKHRKLLRLLASAHDKRVARAAADHEKATKRATRKGLPLPPPPQVAMPEIPAEPRPQPVALANHRWARKAERYRKRMQKRQGNLEVRFEKADARYQQKVQRRIQRLARRLDDPGFVAEHPMLRDTGSRN